jgi:hypothetical protein
VQVDGESELTNAEFVSGDFFRGIALSPARADCCCLRRSRVRAAGRRDPCGLCRAPLRVPRQRGSPQQDPGQQHSVHRRRRDGRGIRRDRAGHHGRALSYRCRPIAL